MNTTQYRKIFCLEFYVIPNYALVIITLVFYKVTLRKKYYSNHNTYVYTAYTMHSNSGLCKIRIQTVFESYVTPPKVSLL